MSLAIGLTPDASTLLLLGGLIPLALGPFLASWADHSGATKAAADAFIAISITGIVVLHIWPHAFLSAGGWSLAGGLAGLLFPFIFHGALHAHERKFYPWLVGIALLGLVLHATLDGVALFAPLADNVASELMIGELGGTETERLHSDHNHSEGDHFHDSTNTSLLAGAVILHRLPMGLAVWWLTVPILGRRAAISVLLLIAAGTLTGFMFGGALLAKLSAPAFSFFEATIAGMLLHVVTGHDHRHHHQEPQAQPTWASALGALVAVVLVVALYQVHPVEHRFADGLTFHGTLSTLSLLFAPWLLLGAALDATYKLARLKSEQPLNDPLQNRLSTTPAALILYFVFGGYWLLLCLFGSQLLLLASTPAREGCEIPPPRTRKEWWPIFEREIHGAMVWSGLAIALAALLESLVQLDWLNGPATVLTLLGAAILGAICCRNAVLGIILAYYFFQSGMAGETVATFLVAGALTSFFNHRKTWLPRLTTQVAVSFPLISVAAIWSASYIAEDHGTNFRAVAADLTPWWRTAALMALLFLAAYILVRRGFRGFLHPVFDPVEDACKTHDHAH